MFLPFLGAWLAHLDDLLSFSDSVDHYEYIFDFYSAPKRFRYSSCGGVF